MVLVNAFREALKADLEKQDPRTSGLVFEFIKLHLEHNLANCAVVERSAVDSTIMDLEDELDEIFRVYNPRRFKYAEIFTDARRALLRTARSFS